MSGKIPIISSSPRFDLIPFEAGNPAHSEFLVTLWNTPLFIKSSGKTSIDTPEKAQGLIERRFIAEYDRKGHGTHLIALKSNDGRESGGDLIGTVSLSGGGVNGSNEPPDLGFAVLPEMNGKGIATEASKVLMEYAKNEHGVKDVFGFCDPDNSTSRRVLEKAGLEFRGVRELAAFGGVKGAVHALPHMDEDLAVYGLKD